MGKKQFDPLWQIVGEDVALQGGEPDIDTACPHCNVTVHIGADFENGALVECGLCGGVSAVERTGESVKLDPRD